MIKKIVIEITEDDSKLINTKYINNGFTEIEIIGLLRILEVEQLQSLKNPERKES